MSNWDEIRFDMSRAGLLELDKTLSFAGRSAMSAEMLNFHNEIQSMLERVPAVKKEASWLDE